MERLCGYMIAAGFAAICFAGYRWWTAEGEVAVIGGAGAVMVVAGFWSSGRIDDTEE